MASKQVNKAVEQKKPPTAASPVKNKDEQTKEEKPAARSEKEASKTAPKDSKKSDTVVKSDSQNRSHGRSRPDEHRRSRERDRGRHSRDDRANHRGQEREVCRNFIQGRCDRGALCRFAHPRSGSRARSAEDSGRHRSPVRCPPRDDGSVQWVVCRDFLRNMCKRGDECRFYHPTNLDSKGHRSSWLTFCRDFQNGHCSRSDCRFFHLSKHDEDNYRASGDIPPNVVDQAVRKALYLDVALTGTRPTCKEFLRGVCTMQNCRFRHLSRREYEDEVFHALKDEFEVILGPAERQQSPTTSEFFPHNNFGEPGSYDLPPDNYREEYLTPDDLRHSLRDPAEFEPEPKRMRHFSEEGMYSDAFLTRQTRWDDRMDYDGQDFSTFDNERFMQEIINLRNDNIELRRSSDQQISELRDKLSSVMQENSVFRMENNNLRSNSSAETMSQKSTIEKLITANNEFQDTIRKLERENSDLRKSLDSKQKAKNNEIDRKIDNLEKENRELKESFSRAAASLKKAEDEKQRLQQAVEGRDPYLATPTWQDPYRRDQLSKSRGPAVMEARGEGSYHGVSMRDQDMRTLARFEPAGYPANRNYLQGGRDQDIPGASRGQDTRVDGQVSAGLTGDLHNNNLRGGLRSNDFRSGGLHDRSVKGVDMGGNELYENNRERQNWSSSGPPPPLQPSEHKTSLLGEYQPPGDRYKLGYQSTTNKGSGLLRTPPEFSAFKSNSDMSQSHLVGSGDYQTPDNYSNSGFDKREYRLDYSIDGDKKMYNVGSRRLSTSQSWGESDEGKGGPGRGIGHDWRRNNSNHKY